MSGRRRAGVPEVLKRTLLAATPGPWRVSIARTLWPDVPGLPDRVFGQFTLWVNKASELVRVARADGDSTHAVVQLIEEDGEAGEPAPQLLFEERAARTWARAAPAASSSSPSSRDTASSSVASPSSEEDAPQRLPRPTVSTKARYTWTHEPDGIKEDNCRSSREDPRPEFRAEEIPTILALFLFVLPDAFGSGAVMDQQRDRRPE